MKRVFVPNKLVTQLFTSDYLVIGGSHRSVPFGNNDTTSFPVIIRNYNPADPGKVNAVTYTLEAELAHKNKTAYTTAELNSESETPVAWISNNMKIEIVDSTNSNNKIELNGTNIAGTISNISNLNTTSRTTHRWNITFTNIDLDSDYCVTLTAKPNKGEDLAATLGISTMPDTVSKNWDCSLAEDIDAAID